MATDEKILKDAQYRKGLGIGFFNATNSAITLVAANRIPGDIQTDEQLIERVAKIRDVFIEQHKEYYANVIANVGAKYIASETIAKIQATKTMEELKAYWISISEDERRDGDILKAKAQMKKVHEKN